MAFLRNIKEISPESHMKTTIESVYEALRQAILVGEIAPESRLRVEELRQKFGVGASTVREALSRLLVENLVTTEGQRGFRAAAVSIEDFKNIVEMRAMFEARAVCDSIRKGDDDWEAALVATHYNLAKIESEMAGREKTSVVEWEKRNRAFHDALVSRCTNDWLLNFREILYNHSVRYIQISVTDRTIPRDVRAEHQAIFDAAIARDSDRAEKLTVDHIYRSVPVFEALFQARASDTEQVAHV